jgi:predicted Zn-dependent protease
MIQGSSEFSGSRHIRLAISSGRIAFFWKALVDSRATRNFLYSLAWAAYSIGQVDEAEQSMRRFLTLAPNCNQSGDARQLVEMGPPNGDIPDSNTPQSLVDDVVKADPNFVPALMAQAALLAKRGESQCATAICRAVLHRFADFAPAEKHLTFLYQQTVETRGEAYDLAVKTRETLRKDPEIAQLLAKLSYERNEFAYVVQLLQQSARERTSRCGAPLVFASGSFEREESTADSAHSRSGARGSTQGFSGNLTSEGPSTSSINRIESRMSEFFT